ncbi:MAG: hypothetical protein ACPIOQ_14580 [Promethearchaeia archaeon]
MLLLSAVCCVSSMGHGNSVDFAKYPFQVVLLTCAHPSCAQPAACEMRARVDIAVQRSDEEWRALLTAEEYRVLRKCGTEAYGKV